MTKENIMLRATDSRTLHPSRSPDIRRRSPSGLAGERGQALLETAMILPLILLVSVSIFEFGRAYQTLQVLTNAAREGARVAILPNTTPSDVQSRVTAYLQNGQLANYNTATVSVNQNATMSIGATTAAASVVTVNYPFSFMVLGPVANLIAGGGTLGSGPLTLTASTEMRNESQ
jgi:Flp pilus assembly protein TadG